jgi:hypothetical protein
MNLKELLTRMVEKKAGLILTSPRGSFSPQALLNTLPQTSLNTPAYYQPGLYIAEINASGYLGAVMYKVEKGEGKKEQG